MVSLFLDDERFPPEKGEWSIVRSYEEAVQYCIDNGCPSYASFDHDLGDNSPTGYDFAKWLVESDMEDEGGFIPSDFSFYVHSQNPVGAKNIQMYLDGYLDFKRKGNGKKE